MLEEAREARRREREDLLTEVTTERRRLATEYSETQRQLDAARQELLAVRSRCGHGPHTMHGMRGVGRVKGCAPSEL